MTQAPTPRPRRSWLGRITRWLVYAILVFVIGSILWVLAYRFVNPPLTFTQLGDILSGNGARGSWMSIERIDRDMVRAAIAGVPGAHVLDASADASHNRCVITFVAPIVVDVALRFGPADYFALMVLSFVTVSAVLGASAVRGLTSKTLSQVNLVSGFGSSCSQALLEKRPS